MKTEINSPCLVEKTVLLTGATGFIGSHLLKRLINEGCKVHILVREKSSLWRIEECAGKYVAHATNLTDFDAVRFLVGEIKPDVIYHLAAYGVDYREQNVQEAIDINVSASVNLFQSFLSNGGKRFIQTGTCMEYGHKNSAISESESLNPYGIYGITKAASTQILSFMASQERNGTLVVLRPFGIFGEFEGTHKFFPQLIENLIKGRYIEMTPGEQIRDYIHVSDLINAYILAAESDSLIGPSEIINIGSGTGVSLKGLALGIARKLKSDETLLQFGSLQYRPNEMMHLVADIKKAESLLGWKPVMSLDEGFGRILEHYSEYFNNCTN